MTVKELIVFLQGQPQDLPVAYRVYSEHSLLDAELIQTRSLCIPREDGWVHDPRPDKQMQDYLVFPGN
jgi:hypothetical protein